MHYATVHISGSINFIENSAQLYGGGVFVWTYATVYTNGISNFIGNSAKYGELFVITCMIVLN